MEEREPPPELERRHVLALCSRTREIRVGGQMVFSKIPEMKKLNAS